MALLTVANDEVCSLQDFCDWVDQYPAQTKRIAQWPELWAKFYSLYNNRSLLTDLLNAELGNTNGFQVGNRYSGQTFILARRPGYYVRANVWPPALLGGACVLEEHFNRFYVYGDQYAHDHNFDFLTVGYFGPGYVTDLYSYDNTFVRGEEGEVVNLRAEGRRVLSEGTMLLFEQGKDVHVQLPPDELTISLNFIPDLGVPKFAQYMFDVDKGIIARMQFNGNRRANMDLLVAEIGNEETRRIYSGLAV